MRYAQILSFLHSELERKLHQIRSHATVDFYLLDNESVTSSSILHLLQSLTRHFLQQTLQSEFPSRVEVSNLSQVLPVSRTQSSSGLARSQILKICLTV